MSFAPKEVVAKELGRMEAERESSVMSAAKRMEKAGICGGSGKTNTGTCNNCKP